MPRNTPHTDDDYEPSANNQFKSVRRAAHQRAKRRGYSTTGRERRLSVRSELREPPDVTKIARAVIALAMARAEAEAEAEARTDRPNRTPPETPDV